MAHKRVGFDERKAEQLAATQGPERTKKMSEKGRIAVARATRKPKGTFGLTANKGGLVKKKPVMKKRGGAVKKKK